MSVPFVYFLSKLARNKGTKNTTETGLEFQGCVHRGVGGSYAFQSSVLVPQNFQAHEPLD